MSQTQHMDPAYAPGGTISALLDMVRRKAPILMRAGGGSLKDEDMNAGRAIDPRMKAHAQKLVKQGMELREVAALLGVSYSTICKHTREIRK